MELPASVAPFILRGVTLAGIDSVMRPLADRVEAWQRLADIIDPSLFADIVNEVSLTEAVDVANQLMEGKVRGRVVVDVNR
jgi:acrylyl-CoA reductase (NADPH)